MPNEPAPEGVKDCPLAELVEMLSAAIVVDGEGLTAFDHTPEEIGLYVMENRKAILAALTQAPAMEKALRAVEAAMLRAEDGTVRDVGWDITALNRARPAIRTLLSQIEGARHG